MRRSVPLAVCAVVALGAALIAQGGRGGGPGAAIKPGEECPPGMTEVRPGNCQAPEYPPP